MREKGGIQIAATENGHINRHCFTVKEKIVWKN